jgi:APA family basic amino acid/polyamine antiporter
MIFGSYIDAILYTAPAVYGFYLATNLAVVVLRRNEPNVQRPYKVTGYPLTTIIFCCVCAFFIYSAVTHALANSPISLVILVIALVAGLIVYRLETSARI